MLGIFKTIFKHRDKGSLDKLGLYPEAVHTQAMPERRYLWTSRILVIFASLSICLNMMLASGIYVMLPQRDASPVMFQHSHTASQLEPIQAQERPIAVIDLLNESFIEEYILMRHAITADYDELMARWSVGSRLFWMSSQKVYQDFVANDIMNNVNEFKMRGLVRLAEVEWIKPISLGFWQAQFITMDYYPDEKVPIVNIWRAYIRTIMAPIPYDNFSLREQNPFGFLVTNYSLSYVGTPDNPVSYMQTAKDVRFEQSVY